MVKVFYFNIMRYIVFILILFFVQQVHAQECPQLKFEDYPDAVTVANFAFGTAGYTSGNVYTSGIYTKNPRVDNGYYLLDFYFVRGGVKNPDDIDSPVNEIWENCAGTNCEGHDFYSSIGSFAISIALKGGLDVSFVDIFDTNDKEFLLNPIFTSNDANCKDAMKFSAFTLGKRQITIAYSEVPAGGRDKNRYAVRLEANTPLYAGTLKLKIKDPSQKASWTFLTTSINVVAYGDAERKCCWYVAGGWLDGKDPDISLDGKEEPTGPTPPPAPVLAAIADTKLCLGKNQAEVKYDDYSVTAAADTVTYYWFVSTSTDPKNPANNNKAQLSTGTGSSVACTWKTAGTYLLNCYVKSKATNLLSDTVSQMITVNNRPTATITFDKQSYVDGNPIKATVSGGS